VETSTGQIIIDGVDISSVPRDLLRERLIVIPQDPFIVSGSVRSNADPHRAASDSEIKAALTKIGIWDTVDRRGGLDAILDEHPLSQGQQQLFCLARAMLRKTQSKILILDGGDQQCRC
jgi:ATP-binding cassette subfamily C (CFTR/MRP) protein 1